MLNRVTLMGRFTKDPELKQTTTGTAVCAFTLACEQDYTPEGGEKKADFIDVVAWKQTGEFVSRNFRKGNLVCVTGRLTIRDWTDKDGNKRRNAEVVADHVYYCEKRTQDWTAAAEAAPEMEEGFPF